MSIPFASPLRALLVTALAATGCGPRILEASTMPPANTPEVDTSAPIPEGHGRVVLDVEEGPVAVRQVRLRAEPLAPLTNSTGEAPIQRYAFNEDFEPLCPATPCVVDLPFGNALLAFRMLGADDGMEAKDLVHVGAAPTVYRRHLDIYTPPRPGMRATGILLALSGAGSALAGAMLLRRGLDAGDDGRTLGGAISLGVGVAVFAFGYWLASRGRATIRPGTSLHYEL